MKTLVLLHLAIISAASRPSYRRYASRTLAETRWSPNVECGNTHCSEQVHLALGGPGEMIVIFVTQDDTTPSEVRWRDLDVDEPQQRLATGSSQTYSQLQWIDPMLIDPAMGAATSTADQVVQLQDPAHKDNVIFGLGMYNNPNLIYNAPLVHQVSLSPCLGGASYEYVVAGDNRVHRFTMPPDAGAAQYPYTFGMTADLGQTAASEANVALLRRTLANADAEGSTATVVLLAGDLAYADGWFSRWDSFGRMMEPLAAEYAVMTTGGNHEIGTGEAWLSYNVRYPMPHQSSGSKSNLWWSRDVGPVHLVALCSYAATHPGSLQYRWLERDLAALDRQRTPWLIVQMHVPWYHSNSLHRDEAVAMRRNMELLLYKAGVDLIIAGHVHAYERTVPVLDGHPNACGPVHLTLGDGGNREGAALPWLEPAPSWSAFRAGSFGVGALRIHNETHALFNWTRTSCEDASAPEHINMDPTCETMANGPWSFGSDDSVHAADHVDPEWLVRPKQRDPILAGCLLPELIEVQTPPPMRTNTMTMAKTSAARVETSSFSSWQGLVSAVPLALTVVLAGLIGFRLGARSSRRLPPADSLPARLEVCTEQEQECAYLAMP